MDNSQRAIAIITAFYASYDHMESGTDAPDVAGEELMKLIYEILEGIYNAESDAEAEAAEEVLFGTILDIVGIIESLLAHLDIDIDLYDMMQHLALENAKQRS